MSEVAWKEYVTICFLKTKYNFKSRFDLFVKYLRHTEPEEIKKRHCDISANIPG